MWNNPFMRKGQGLLETIVAIGVIMTGLISVMTLVISNLTNAREAAMRYQAVNLAREGIERIRNVRDTNWLESENVWNSDITNEAQLLSQSLVPPFSHFSRSVQVTTPLLLGNNARTITSTVSWQSGGRENEIKLTATLYDWR